MTVCQTAARRTTPFTTAPTTTTTAATTSPTTLPILTTVAATVSSMAAVVISTLPTTTIAAATAMVVAATTTTATTVEGEEGEVGACQGEVSPGVVWEDREEATGMLQISPMSPWSIELVQGQVEDVLWKTLSSEYTFLSQFSATIAYTILVTVVLNDYYCCFYYGINEYQQSSYCINWI